MVMIGIDPHKRNHTAVAVSRCEDVLGKRLVHAGGSQVAELIGWADRLDDVQRTWAIESAGGLGYLLAQQLLAAGERVVDIPAVLSARVRVLSSGTSNKNDPNDAFSVAVAALHAKQLIEVRVEDHASEDVGRALVAKLTGDLQGRFSMVGYGTDGVKIVLNPGEEMLADELIAEYGDAVDVTVCSDPAGCAFKPL